MSDIGEEEVRGFSACRAHVGRRRRQSRIASQAPGYLVDVSGHDRA
jgi:hypothetical protein